jgi:glutaminyl-peptide cyclotransferase
MILVVESDSLDDINNAHSMKRQQMIWMIPVIVAVTAAILLVAAIAPVNETNETTTAPPSRSQYRRSAVTSSTRTQMGTFRLLQTLSHDSNAFTQGLVTVYDPSDEKLKFYEGTGVNGQSQLRLVNIDTGTVLAQHSLPFRYFGEGITQYLDNIDSNLSTLRLIQLTWQEQTAFEYEIQNNATSSATSSTSYSEWLTRVQNIIRTSRFCSRRRRLRLCLLQNSTVSTDNIAFSLPLTVPKPNATLQYSTTTSEGWGITYSKQHHQLYVTDGSSYLHTWDVATKKEITKVSVTYQYSNMDAPMSMNRLNELEYDPVTNTILANVWLTNMIVRIDVATGFILTIYDFSSLYTDRTTKADVFNGIALTYDAIQQFNNNNTTGIQTDQVWVTGKYWPSIYRVQLIDP